MRHPEDEALHAIEGALAGESVDPEFAELAELSLLMRASRPRPAAEFAHTLDRRMQDRFATPRLRRLTFPAMGAVAAASLASLVAVIVLSSSAGVHVHKAPLAVHAPAPSAAGSATSQDLLSAQPPANGRKVIQSANLSLGAPPDRIDAVSQELLNVVGSVNGIVDRSSVASTGGPDGNAQFQLRVPSAQLSRTMTALSRLRYANVVSRTDQAQDVNSAFVNVRLQLSAANTLRSTLLKRLAAATSQQEIDQIKGELSGVERTIARLQAGLRGLERAISYSRIDVTIQANAGSSGAGGPFDLHKAGHDAVRVLTVAAGVALVGLAALFPIGLVGSVAWSAAMILRRRRREHALELA